MTARRQQKNNIIVATTILVFILVAAIFLTRPAATRPNIIQNWSANPTPVYGKTVVTQTFVPTAGELSAVGVRFGLYKPVKAGYVEWRLYKLDAADRRALVMSRRIPVATIENGVVRDFVFSAVPDSRGQRFQFTISAPALKKAGPVAVFLSGKMAFEKPYPLNKTYWNGEETAQDLDFVAYSNRSNSEIFNVWLAGRGRFVHVGAPWFIALLIAGLGAAIGRMLARSWEAGAYEDDE